MPQLQIALIASILAAVPFAAQAQPAAAPTLMKAALAVSAPVGRFASRHGPAAQPTSESVALRLAVRPARLAPTGDAFAEVRAKDTWLNDDGFRIAKGRLAFKHRF